MASLSVKRLVLGTAEACYVNAITRRLNGSGLTALCYHGVVEKPQSGDRELFGNTVSIAEFTSQLDYIGTHFHPVTVSEISDSLNGGPRLPHNSIAITFDDGYRNNLIHAAPVLRKKGMPAVFHLTTNYIGRCSILWPDEILLRLLDWPEQTLPSPTGPALPAGNSRFDLARMIKESCKRITADAREEFLETLRTKTPPQPSRYLPELHDFMTWDEARQLARQGFGIGSHTLSHPILSGLDTPALARELRDSRAAIEKEIGAECLALAYPNGGKADFSTAVLEMADAAGYSVAFSVEDRIAGAAPHRFAVPRVSVPGHIPLPIFYSKVSGLYSYLQAEW